MRALVTGGHGFIGSHLCRRLLAEGHQVRILARASSDTRALDGLAVEKVQGDLESGEGLLNAVSGVDCVFHLAGLLKGFCEADFFRVNAEGTGHLANACLQAPKPPRLVLVSSLAAAGPSSGGFAAVTEDAPPHPLTWYGHSKLAAERVVQVSGLDYTILRPPVVFGPQDRDVLDYFRIAKRGLLPIPGHQLRHYSLVFAPDLVEGILRAAMSSAASREIFNLTGPEVVTWEELGHKIAAVLGVRGRVLHLPEWAIGVAGRVADLAARLQGKPQIFSSQKVVEMLAPAWVASGEKAERLLGWKAATKLDEALAMTAHWYRERGWL